MSKAKYEKLAPVMKDEIVRIDNSTVFLRTFRIYSGADVVNAMVVGASLKNVQDRKRLEDLAWQLLSLARHGKELRRS